MVKKKIVIIGGGFAGLSVAHILCQYKDFDITIIEKEKELGGQAASNFGKYCYVEHCWRVFFNYYNIVYQILKDINAYKNLIEWKDFYLITKKNNTIDFNKIWYQFIKNGNYFNLILELDVDRSIVLKTIFIIIMPYILFKSKFKNTTVNEYYSNNTLVNAITGPILGLEPKKLSLLIFKKKIERLLYNKSQCNYNKWKVTNKLPNEDIFKPWKKYLLSKNVKILCNTECISLNINNTIIDYVLIKKNKNISKLYGDIFITACNIYGCLKIFKNLSTTKTYNKLKHLKKYLQYYFSINLYFKKPFKNNIIKSFCLIDKPWQPLVRIYKSEGWNKYLSSKKIKKDINEVWNVAVFDFVKGENTKLILRNQTLKSSIKEIIYQLSTSKFIKDLEKKNNINFKDNIIGYEPHYHWKNKNNKIFTNNPKFSFGLNCEKYLIPMQPKDMPTNLYFSAYYVKGVMEASMEQSSLIGTECAKLILKKYKKNLPKRFKSALNKTKTSLPYNL